MQDTLHKTLIIRFSSVGDIVLASPLVRVLRRRFPGIRIDFAVKSEYADLVRFDPGIARVIEFPSHGTLRNLARLRREIRAEGYDLLIDIHDSIRSRILCAGRSRVVRIRKRKIARFLLVRLKRDVYRFFGGSPGITGRYLETVREFGVAGDGDGPEVFFPQAAAEKCGALLRASGVDPSARVIALCPSARHNTKMWLKERFAETAAALAPGRGTAVALLGSREERARCAEIEQRIRAMAPEATVINLAGTISLPETSAFMDRCSLVVTNDSGLMHIAAARRRPVVAVFGPTVRQFGFFPAGPQSTVLEHPSLPCRPCTAIGGPSCPKGHFRCMTEIPTSQVVAAARKFLEP